MSHDPFHASLSPSRLPRTPDRRVALLATGALFSLLCVASLFWMHVDLVALLHEWSRADASLPLIALGTVAVGPLIAAGLGE
ncbi:hypothetical protein LMG31506_01438 [Cupriavidus yeoncheonensis]|uniref:Uncharacterized protein n=1 Tax=Cupriavidus yeoncheonensis TaxID=1462994 RepID=A0A916N2L8_9BURK|nr:hypothetical protein [Cupriavidus yeoncheonensis]CAG2134783.1 hypothetical protein LMG31506_01438 [Cupriavidus yeoncheonensis]